MRLPKNWHIPPRRVVLWYAISALPLGIMVALGGYLTYHYRVLSSQNREEIDRSYEVLEGVAAVFVSVEDADVAQRDFLISGSSERLNAFRAAERAILDRQTALHERLDGDPSQLLRLSKLQAAIARKTAELAQTASIRQTADLDTVRGIVSHQDPQLMEGVRSEAAALAGAERQLLRQRQVATRQHERNVLLVGALIASASVAIRIFIALWLAHRRRKGTGHAIG